MIERSTNVPKEQRAAIIAAAAIGVARKDIAVQMGLPINRVAYVLNDERKRHIKATAGAALAQTPAPAAQAPAPDALLDTGGRYAALNAYAADLGITYRQALQRWHRARLGLPLLGVM